MTGQHSRTGTKRASTATTTSRRIQPSGTWLKTTSKQGGGQKACV